MYVYMLICIHINSDIEIGCMTQICCMLVDYLSTWCFNGLMICFGYLCRLICSDRYVLCEFLAQNNVSVFSKLARQAVLKVQTSQ